jgi:polyhydroxyalkanoate synthesis regulator phasin
MPKATEEYVSESLLLKRKKNSEAARRCRDKIKSRIAELEHENEVLLQEKRQIHLKLVETETMLATTKKTASKQLERIEELESRLAQFQKYVLFTQGNNSHPSQNQTNVE